jgi:16S rRNA (cytosine1402-N4)-methyltransferase
VNAHSGEGENSPHLPVLYHEIITAIHPVSAGRYVDGTVGAGGHAWGILDASSPHGMLLGLDLDPQALQLAQARLAAFGDRVTLRQATYASIEEQIRSLGWPSVQGIVLDLGVSSMQLNTPERGFSFQDEGPLDMRFDPTASLTAADLVNTLSERELSDLLWQYGEERLSRQIARDIVRTRPFSTTQQLAAAVSKAYYRGSRSGSRSGGGRKGGHRIHPATRTFQALRIAVNHELQALEASLPKAVAVLAPGGRLAVLSFHSLEDRIVKQYFRRESQDCICPPGQPICTCGHKAAVKRLSHRPIQPGEEEVARNPRARSARLRVVEKV